MMGYLKQGLVVAFTLAVIYRVEPIRKIVIGA